MYLWKTNPIIFVLHLDQCWHFHKTTPKLSNITQYYSTTQKSLPPRHLSYNKAVMLNSHCPTAPSTLTKHTRSNWNNCIFFYSWRIYSCPNLLSFRSKLNIQTNNPYSTASFIPQHFAIHYISLTYKFIFPTARNNLPH